MRIAMIGAKGVPATHGGVERHVEELGARLVGLGHEVVVFTRPDYTDPSLTEYRGMRLVSLPTLGTKRLDAPVHTLLASLYCWGGGFDVVHYHAIGPAIFSPLARLRGRRVVATIHAQDWRREKWGRGASALLRLGESVALRVPHVTISVSRSLAEAYNANGHRVVYIPNGVTVEPGDDPAYLASLGLEDRGYLLYVGRLVPEKGVHTLIDAHARLGPGAPPLVIAGDTSHTDRYVADLKASAGAGVRFLGNVYGVQLATLFRHAALFVLPSTVEGLPLVLMEAIAYGAPLLVSDIAPNLEVAGSAALSFPARDTDALVEELDHALEGLDGLLKGAALRKTQALSQFDWDAVARRTETVYGYQTPEDGID